MRVTEAKMKGIETFCATVGCSSEERTLALVGARLFFEKGWPTTCFTVPMAISAAKGLLPHKYTKARSRARYEYAMAH